MDFSVNIYKKTKTSLDKTKNGCIFILCFQKRTYATSLKEVDPKWRGSSVGRATDWKSVCHRFDPGPCHHFFVLMPDGDTPFGFFCACIWGWIARIYLYFGKTENLKSPHSGGLKSVKIPQILRLAIFGDTGIFQVVTAWYAKKILQNCHCFSLFSSECNGEFLYTNRSPLGIIFDNQRVTR